MGPGIMVKAVLRGSFSLMVFGWTQIVMDIQPLIVLLTGQGHLHGFTHTYLGATLIGAFSAVTGKYFSEWGLRVVRLDSHTPISWPIAVVSALIGSYSHVVLDSIMHADMEPLFPFSRTNELLGLISVSALHAFCVYSGILGGLLYFGIHYLRARRI
jgi:membrane-bound metal-dependent hydrolase YbcI (DUF457 family)